MSITDFRSRDFSEYCEYSVAFKLEELGWKVYQPLIDRYIDIVAMKKVKGKNIFRTIQVKGSRVEEENKQYRSYGLTHKPKDLLHDPRHFFIWLFINKDGKENYIILSIEDFINVRSNMLPQSTRRKYDSLLKRESWRVGNDREHPKYYKKKKEWKLEGSLLNSFLNNFKELEKTSKIDISRKCILAQELNPKWKKKDKKVIDQRKKHNKIIINRLKRSKKLWRSVNKLIKIDEDQV